MIENDAREAVDRADAVTGKTRDALRAAHLYYMQDLTMDAIAHELHTSRSSISRLLSHARASGLVEISIHSPLDLPSRIEQEILERHEVRAQVVPVPRPRQRRRSTRPRRALAARILSQYVDSNQTIGVAGLDDERDEPAPGAEGHAQHRDRAAQRGGQRAHHRHPVRERSSSGDSATPSVRGCSSSPCPPSSTTRRRSRPSGANAARAGCSTCRAARRRDLRGRLAVRRGAEPRLPGRLPRARRLRGLSATAPWATSRPSSTAPMAAPTASA